MPQQEPKFEDDEEMKQNSPKTRSASFGFAPPSPDINSAGRRREVDEQMKEQKIKKDH
jgi:hypothetical protein